MSARAKPGGLHRGAEAFAALLSAVVAMAAVVPAARAQPRYGRQRGYRLDFQPLADPTCPTEKALREDAAHLAGQTADPFDPAGRHVLRIVVRKGALYEASMELLAPDGSRHPRTPLTYAATTCAQAMREATVAAVGFIPLDLTARANDTASCDGECRRRVEDARAEARREGYAEGERDGRERGRREGRNERQDEIAEQIDDAIARRWSRLGLPTGRLPMEPPRMTFPFAVSTGGVLAIGYAVDVAPGFMIGGEWRPAEMFSLGVEARALPPAKIGQFGTISPIPVRAAVFSGLIAPCARWKILVGCGVLELGAFWVEKDDIWGGRYAAGPRVGIDVPFAERFSVRVMGDMMFPLRRIYLPIQPDKGGEPYIEPIVSGFITAGLSVAF